MSEEFVQLIEDVTAAVAGRPVGELTEEFLNRECGPDSEFYRRMRAACEEGIEQGWLCDREAGGIRFGRVIKPGPDTHDFSVDVVLMKDVVGPHHRHPGGELDLVMPLTEGAQFDGRGAGWKVYEPDSAHKPTVTGGEAIVLYLLPGGQIEFTRA